MNPSLQDPSFLTKIQRRLFAPVRLIPKLQRFRGNRYADWIRRRIVAQQAGLEPLPFPADVYKNFTLWVPPSWRVSRSDERRLLKLLRIRQVRSQAQIVSCDDWVPARRTEKLRWREKGQLDFYFDRETGSADGPLLISQRLVQRFGIPPEDFADRPFWRKKVFDFVGTHGWAHVALPLAVSPRVPLEPAIPSMPKCNDLVSVLIPSGAFLKSVGGRDKMMIRHCLETLLQRSDYRNLEIVLVDGGEFSDQELLEFEFLVEASLGPGRWVHCRDNREYSYSLRMNLAAAKANGACLLQLNDDTELLEPKAIASMAALLEDPGIGVVGSLLLYEGGRVQHAGVAVDNLAPNHPWSGNWLNRLPVDLLVAPRQFQAVTAAVCMCRSETWSSLGGLREDLPVNYGDVDFCLRARELGLAVILDPASRWTHFESASRILSKVPAELPRFRELWRDKLGGSKCIDPYASRWRELRSVR